MKRLLLLSLLLGLSAPALAEEHLLSKATFELIAGEYSGEAALDNVQRIIQYHRIQGSPMMAAVAAQVVLERLRAAGLEARVESFPSDGRIRYQTMLSPMGWSIRAGELWVEEAAGTASAPFHPLRLCRYADVPMCVSTYSRGGSWRGELIDVGPGTSAADYQGKDVRGKVALASGYAAAVMRQAVLQRGAVGVVIYPDAHDRPEQPDLIRYNGLWPRAEDAARQSSGFQISANQYAQLRRLMERGPVRVRGTIDATLAPGELTVVHAYLRGSAEPEREVLLTAHLDHPKWSANDNASGAGALLELARALKALVTAGKLAAPRRTLHFMWVPEFFGTMAYVTRHPEARRCGAWDDPRPPARDPRCIVANLNLDMVGEDTARTYSRFYATRMPDSVPSYLDALLADVIDQTERADLRAPTGSRNLFAPVLVPYAQGSDHDIFLGLGIPATMLGHAPDWTHHSSADTLDKIDATELLRVGVLSSAAAVFLASATERDWLRLWPRALASEAARHSRQLAQLVGSEPAADRQALPALPAAILARLQQRLGATTTALSGPTSLPPGRLPDALALPGPPPASGKGPRRLVLLPIEGLDDPPADKVAGADLSWLSAQRSFAAAHGTSLELLVFEAINFMDGRRPAAEIAAELHAEFLCPIDAAWVERLVHILAALKLVSES